MPGAIDSRALVLPLCSQQMQASVALGRDSCSQSHFLAGECWKRNRRRGEVGESGSLSSAFLSGYGRHARSCTAREQCCDFSRKWRQASGSRFLCRAAAAAAPDHLMIVSDLDLTMVDHQDPSHSALLHFNALWEAEYGHNSILVFSTGRSPQKYSELRRQVPLLTPAIAILSVGTEIRYGHALEPDHGWEKYLNDGWDRDVVVEEAKKFPTLIFQEDSEQRPHKVSFKVEKKEAENIKLRLAAKLKDLGLKVKLIYSGGIDLDVLPHRAGKGEALAYLLKKQRKEGWATNKTLVCGDSGNDIELFTVQGVNGVIVCNAMEELVHWYQTEGSKASIHRATKRCAGGIMEALGHFSLGPHLSPRERIGNHGFTPSISAGRSGIVPPGAAQREVVEFVLFLEKWLQGELNNTDSTFDRLAGAIAKQSSWIDPWGSEQSLVESVGSALVKHGAMKDLVTWVDRVKEHKLGEGAFFVTCELWYQQSRGVARKGLFATTILQSKAENPDSLELVRVHISIQRSD